MTARVVCLAGTLAVVLAGCATEPLVPPDNRDADAKVLRQVESKWSQAMATKDPEKIAANYSDDASLQMPGKKVVTGKTNIATELKTYFSDKNATMNFSTNRVAVARSSDMGYSQGIYSATLTNPKVNQAVSEKGKYVAVYMKQADGTWKAVSVSTTPDGPQVPVKGAPGKSQKP